MQFIVSGARSRTEQNPGNISVHRASCIVHRSARGTWNGLRNKGIWPTKVNQGINKGHYTEIFPCCTVSDTGFACFWINCFTVRKFAIIARKSVFKTRKYLIKEVGLVVIFCNIRR